MGLIAVPSDDHFQFTLISEKILQKHHIDIDGAVVIFQYTDIFSSLHKELCVSPDERRLAGAEKTCDQVNFHKFTPENSSF